MATPALTTSSAHRTGCLCARIIDMHGVHVRLTACGWSPHRPTCAEAHTCSTRAAFDWPECNTLAETSKHCHATGLLAETWPESKRCGL